MLFSNKTLSIETSAPSVNGSNRMFLRFGVRHWTNFPNLGAPWVFASTIDTGFWFYLRIEMLLLFMLVLLLFGNTPYCGFDL